MPTLRKIERKSKTGHVISAVIRELCHPENKRLVVRRGTEWNDRVSGTVEDVARDGTPTGRRRSGSGTTLELLQKRTFRPTNRRSGKLDLFTRVGKKNIHSNVTIFIL